MASHYESRRTGKPDARVGDRTAAHCEPTVAHHDVTTIQCLSWQGKRNFNWEETDFINPGRLAAAHRELLLNHFRAKKQFSSGVIEGQNYTCKVTLRKAYSHRTSRIAGLSLYHVLGRLPEPQLAHRFF
jgi:hypothetical protein